MKRSSSETDKVGLLASPPVSVQTTSPAGDRQGCNPHVYHTPTRPPIVYKEVGPRGGTHMAHLSGGGGGHWAMVDPPAPALGSSSPGVEAPFPVEAPLMPPPPVAAPPPVQVPPQQFEKPAVKSAGSVFGFLWDAVVKVQDGISL
ncbi:hypothetical protein GW17_00062425 [Ensete ventricosum]|nr:hypothetical protein GW17_00062425 [Ensete ventricosum]